MKKIVRNICKALPLLLLATLFAGCVKTETEVATNDATTTAAAETAPESTANTADDPAADATQVTATNDGVIREPSRSFAEGEHPLIEITMENGDVIRAELYPEIAPVSVDNFLNLVESGFYDGLIFHRVIPGFMVQGGDPDGNGTGGPDWSIVGEFAANGIENTLKHERGVLSMARSNHPDSAGSQFFIMVDTADFLDGEYAAFGKVLDGMDAVDKIVSADRDGMDKPLEDQRIKTVQVVG